MAFVGLGHYVVVVLHVRGSKSSYTKLALHREPRTGKTWFLAALILPIEELVDVRELLEEAGLALIAIDLLTMLSDAPVPVALHGDRRHRVYVFSSYVMVPYVTSNLRNLANSSTRLLPNRPLIHQMVHTSYHKRLALTVFRLRKLSMDYFRR
jgi:8-oxo-dGTP pyrophosphatase MutT (NUDIX family)